jgi:hypothetical protein
MEFELPPTREDDVASPCIFVCTLDDSNRFCIGCGRTSGEIAAWTRLNADEKRAVLMASDERLAKLA